MMDICVAARLIQDYCRRKRQKNCNDCIFYSGICICSLDRGEPIDWIVPNGHWTKDEQKYAAQLLYNEWYDMVLATYDHDGKNRYIEAYSSSDRTHKKVLMANAFPSIVNCGRYSLAKIAEDKL